MCLTRLPLLVLQLHRRARSLSPEDFPSIVFRAFFGVRPIEELDEVVCASISIGDRRTPAIPGRSRAIIDCMV